MLRHIRPQIMTIIPSLEKMVMKGIISLIMKMISLWKPSIKNSKNRTITTTLWLTTILGLRLYKKIPKLMHLMPEN